MGNSEELLWHGDVMVSYGRAHASVASRDVEGFELKTYMYTFENMLSESLVL